MNPIKRGDVGRVIEDVLTLDGTAANLTGASVKFVGKITPGKLPTTEEDLALLEFKEDATIVTAAAGEVSYTLTADNVKFAGTLRFEWEVTFADSTVTTFPSGSYGELSILADLG